MSSTRPSSATSSVADEDAEPGRRRGRSKIGVGTRIPTTIASPPMRGIGPRVDARAVGLVVDAADQRRERGDDRRQHEHDADRDEEAPGRRAVLARARGGSPEGHVKRSYSSREWTTAALATFERLMTEIVIRSRRSTSASRTREATRRNRRARLRRAAAGDGVRRGRASRSPASTSTTRAGAARSRSGRSYLVDVPAERYGNVDGRLQADDGLRARCAELDALTICVPTPLSKTRTPDLSYIVSAAESVAAHLRHGQLVVLQSTTYPGTTEEVVLPILEARGRPRRRATSSSATRRSASTRATTSTRSTTRRSCRAA